MDIDDRSMPEGLNATESRFSLESLPRRMGWELGGIWLAVAVLAAPCGGQEPAIEVTLDRDEVYVGESVQLRVLLNQFPEDAMPQFEPSADYSLRVIQKTIANKMMTTMIGSRVQRVVERGPLILYELTPHRPGQLTIPGPTAAHEGQTLQAEEMQLRVMDVAAQDYVRLELSVDKATVYPTQRFTVRLLVSVKSLPEPYQDHDPLIVRPLPTLTIPWADDDALGDSVESVLPRDRWLSRMLDSKGEGFSVNDYQGRRDVWDLFDRGPFDSFGGRRRRDTRLAFRPAASRIVANDLQGRKVQYWQYAFDRQFVARRAGLVEFGPVTVKGEFGKRVNGRQLETEPVYAIARPLSVSVIDPPAAGRPAEFVGAIGEFECGATITPSQAKVGDPMTLTLWLQGSGSLEDAVAPALQNVPSISQHFKLYDATAETQGDRRQFVYSLRPKDSQVEAFPPVAMAYFDVEEGKYVTLRTDPLPITVEEADRLRRDEIAIAAQGAARREGIESSDEGIFANVTDLRLLRDETVRPDQWLLGLGSMAGLFLVFVVGKQQLERRGDDAEQSRRRKAASRARQRIEAARRAQDESSAVATADQLSGALVGLVADACGLAEQGLTSGDAVRRLQNLEIDDSLVGRYREFLDECDAIRYGSAASPFAQLVTRAGDIADELSRVLPRTRRLP